MKLPDRLEPGLVLRYSYLWAADAERGDEEGRKDRPAVVVLAREIVRNSLVVTVAAITHSPPRDGSLAVAVGPAIKKRLGLDDEASWIVTSELNAFVWPGPDLRPIAANRGADGDRCYYGYIPNSLLNEVKQSIAENRRRQLLMLSRRSE